MVNLLRFYWPIFLPFILPLTRDSFVNELAYKMTVSFHVNLLYDYRFDEFTITPSKTSKGTKEDNISDVLSFQLKQLEDILIKNGLEVYSLCIQGEYLATEDIVKVDISEDTSKPWYTGRGKNKKRMKLHVIMPNLPYIREKSSELAAKKLGKMYNELMNLVKDKKIMSEILEVKETQNDRVLITAFLKQYGDLWLATDEKRTELLKRLEERLMFVVDKYSDNKIEA